MTQDLLFLLGILDNYHDFADFLEKPSNKFIKEYFKEFYTKIINCNQNIDLPNKFKKYFIYGSLSEINNNMVLYDVNNGFYNLTGNEYSDEKYIFNFFISKYFQLNCIRNRIRLVEIKKIIISNFYILFDYTQIPDNEIIKIRIPLYHLIKKLKNNEYDIDLITFFEKIIGKYYNNFKVIESVIKCNVQKINDNFTYPITYTIDMNVKPYQFLEFNFNEYEYIVIDINKKNFDGAKTPSNFTKIHGLANGINVYEGLNNIGKLILDINKKEDFVINFFGAKYWFYDDKIFCTYDNICFSITNNTVPFIKTLLESFIEYINTGNLCLKMNKYKINLDEYIETLNKIKFHKSKNPIGLITFLLFGCKRYGDWIQAKFSKNNYMGIQTTDALLQLYMIFSGSPIIANGFVYNYEPLTNLNVNDFRILELDKNTCNDINNQHKIKIHDNLVGVSRDYFIKYIKYKQKYNRLKRLLTQKNKLIN